MNHNIFPNANGVSFTNSNISVNVYAEDLKKRLKPSKIANHKHHLQGENLRRTVCTAGTRERILNDITTWAYDTSPDSPSLYWLLGPAGSGKTTIAYTIARCLETKPAPDQRKVVGANFFCSRQFPETRLACRIIPTIVYQLAVVFSAFADALNRCGDFDTVDHDAKSQLEGLLITPWAESETSRLADPSTPSYYTIVVDALDEIEETGGTEFLLALLDAIEEQRLRGLKIFVTSRPDPALVGRVDSFPDRQLYRLEKVPPDEAQDDIRKYLGASLPDVRRDVVEKLVNLADGLFIYAATIVKYLAGYESLEQEELLDDLFSTTDSGIPPPSPDFGTPPLDELYHRILNDAFRGLQPTMRERRLRILHTFLCMAERTSTVVVAHLLAESSNQIDSYTKIVNGVLGRLHSVLFSDGDKVLWYHKSFPDFIFAQARSEGFWCNQTALHRQLTNSCFRIMKEGLRFNIANIPSSCDLDSDNSTLLDMFRRDIPRALPYSCHHWSYHLSATTSTAPEPLVGTFSEFLQLRVLFWIEVMNLLKSRGLCNLMLRTASEWVRKHDAAVARKLSEAAMFAMYFSSSPASSSTPHLYISALATAPLSVDHWKSYFPGIPRFTGASRQVDAGALMTLRATGPVTSVAVSRDGTRIVSGSTAAPRIIRAGVHLWLVEVWNASTGEKLRQLKGHTFMVSSVAFSNDGTRIVSGSFDGSVLVWNSTTGDQLRVFKVQADAVSSVAISNDGTRIVSGYVYNSVRVWNATTGEQMRVLEGHSGTVRSVAFSPDGTCIVSCSDDRSVRVWNVTTGEELKKLGHAEPVHSVAFSSDGSRIVSGSSDRSLRVWNATTGEQLSELEGHTDVVSSVAFSNDDTRIVSGSGYLDGSVRVWNVTTGEQLRKLEGHTDLVGSVAFSNDGTCVISGSYDATVRVWDVTTGEQWRELDGHSGSVTSVAFSYDRTHIVSGSDDRSVRVWNATTGEQLGKFDGHTEQVTSVGFSKDGTEIVSGSDDRSVRLWNATTGEQLKKLDGHTDRVTGVHHCGILILSYSDDGTARVWLAPTGEYSIIESNFPTDVTPDSALSNDGTRKIFGHGDGFVNGRDLTTTELEQVICLDGHSGPVRSVAFSRDDTLIVSGSDDRSVRVWDVMMGEQLQKLVGQSAATPSIAFSQEEAHVASVSQNKPSLVRDLGICYLLETKSGFNTGWLLSPDDYTRLMFVPLEARLPDSSMILSIPPSASVDFTNTSLGPQWHDCYCPDPVLACRT